MRDGRARKAEEIYANDPGQDYKMASLIPVTILNFARFLLSSRHLSLRLLFCLPHFLLSLRAPRSQTDAILPCTARSALLTESRRISSSKRLPGDDSRILLRDDSNEYGRRDALISQRRVIKRRRTLGEFLIRQNIKFILFRFPSSYCNICTYCNKHTYVYIMILHLFILNK